MGAEPSNKKNHLGLTHPNLKLEWADIKKFENFSKGSDYKAQWKCRTEDHFYNMRISYKVKGYSCNICTGRKVLKGFNDLPTLYPNLVKEWHPDNKEKIDECTKGQKRKVKWICQRNQKHVWIASIAHRTNNEHPTNCPYCAGRKVLIGDNDLSTTDPEVAKKWSANNLLKPTEVTSGSNKKVEWKCNQCLHLYVMKISDKTGKGQSCPFCSGQKIVVGFNDLATTHPLIAKELNDKEFKSTELTAASGRKVKWKCSLNHEYEKIVANRTKQGQGCPNCSGRKILKGFNDLSTTHPELKEYWKDTSKKICEVSSGSGFIAKWECEKEHSFKRAVYDMVKSPDCPVCSGKLILSGVNDLQTLFPTIAKEWSYNNPVSAAEISPGSSNAYEWECSEGHLWNAVPNNRTRLGHGCPKCWLSSNRSKKEQEIYEYLIKILPSKIEVEQNNRSILDKNKELDIYIPEKKFAIEYNGIYWHSEAAGKDKWYHYNKWSQCKDKGIQLITIWEDDYKRNPELIKRMIAHKLNLSKIKKIPGRKSTFEKVSNQEAKDFYHENHLQGNHQSSKHYALKKDEEIVGMMSIRHNAKKQELEISRFATIYNVQGGFSKLLSNVLKEESYISVEKVFSYSHNDHSLGELYRKNSFTLVSEGTPGYFYFKKGDTSCQRKHRLNYSPKRFKERKDLDYEPNKTERELAEMNNLMRIWDCGSSRWEKYI